MLYLVPVAVIVLGLAADLLVEISAELSSEVLMEADAGVTSHGARIIGGNIVDMRPETSLPGTLK
ncbi:hypothetical protein [Ancylobacter sp. TS-1]|uniref:hypothetical protein n=1 Tax=Ancylobacter sp. TS-1 TaxID=1850374 RepID=UPI001265B779|nr:hypothetical protein [Ancylobacter sp. TS-1]QFR32697.1 hypothetical protein GBB76_05905 [Ancylobacter sp. TS-1]